MKILFVCSGNAVRGISPIVENQAESLRKEGIWVDVFPVSGKGFSGYLKNIPKLRYYLKENKYDAVHAHYTLTGFVSALAGARPLIVSLMGSDVISSGFLRFFIKLFNRLAWNNCIVKSEEMKDKLGISGVRVIPNGVDIDRFRPISRTEGLLETGWNSSCRHVLFGSRPDKPVKNYALFCEAVAKLNDPYLEIHSLGDVPNEKMPYYFASSDLLVLTSLWEGSPNVIKEAMACNCPLTCTDVGDVNWLINGVPGCAITTFDPENVAKNMREILEYGLKNGRSEGRNRIISLGLDSKRIAQKLSDLYNVCKRHAN